MSAEIFWSCFLACLAAIVVMLLLQQNWGYLVGLVEGLRGRRAIGGSDEPLSAFAVGEGLAPEARTPAMTVCASCGRDRAFCCEIPCPSGCGAMAKVYAHDWRSRGQYRAECENGHWGDLGHDSELLPPEWRRAP